MFLVVAVSDFERVPYTFILYQGFCRFCFFLFTKRSFSFFLPLLSFFVFVLVWGVRAFFLLVKSLYPLPYAVVNLPTTAGAIPLCSGLLFHNKYSY